MTCVAATSCVGILIYVIILHMAHDEQSRTTYRNNNKMNIIIYNYPIHNILFYSEIWFLIK